MSRLSFLYVTTPSLKVAKQISKKLLDEKLIACANIFQNMESIYVWKNKIEKSKECVLILKTTSKNLNQVRSKIELMHPYETPCIAEIKIESMNKSYQNWIMDSCRPH